MSYSERVKLYNENKELYLKGLFNSFNICEIAQKQIKEKCSS